MILNSEYEGITKVADVGTFASNATAFAEGFADGFGFSGLFARLHQDPLTDAGTFAGFNGAQDEVTSIPVMEAKASLRATK